MTGDATSAFSFSWNDAAAALLTRLTDDDDANAGPGAAAEYPTPALSIGMVAS